MNPILIVIPILAVLMLSIGLSIKTDDFKLIITHPLPVITGLICQIIFLPLIALLIALTFHLQAEFAVGLILIACCPGGSSSNIFSKIAGGDVALSVSLTALSSVITLSTLPLFMSGAMTLLDMGSTHITLPVGALLLQNIILMLVPIIIGISIKHFLPDTAISLERVLSKTAFPALILLASIFFIQHYQTFVANFRTLWLSVTLLLIISMLLGAAVCKLLSLSSVIRRTLTIEIGMQNAAQAIAVASSPLVLNNDTIAIPAIVYSLMMNIILISYVTVVRCQLSITD